jgi:ParB-like chromosome segregation protein Spo0J
MKTETAPIESLLPDPSNVREHDGRNIDAIKASLLRFGQQKPIVVDSDGVVIAGNGTFGAAKMLGWTSLEVVRTELAGAEAVAYAIADNRTAELADWDETALALVLEQLTTEDGQLEAAGFTEEELGQMITRLDPTGGEFPDLPERGLRSVTLVMTHEDGEDFDRVIAQLPGKDQGAKVAQMSRDWEAWKR